MIIKHDENGREYSTYSHEEYHRIGYEEAISASQFKLFLYHEKALVDNAGPEKNRGMVLGTAFEDYIYDRIGINKSFEQKYIDVGECDIPSNIEDVLNCKGYLLNTEKDMGSMSVNMDRDIFYKKTASGRKGNYKSNETIDIVFDSGFKIPLRSVEINLLERMFDSLSSLEAEPFVRYVDLLKNDNVEIERIILWEKDGIRKKCKPDVLIINDDIVYYDDIKTTISPLEGFHRDISNYKYPIQAIHTREGIQEAYPGHRIVPCRYIVVSKKAPVLAKIFSYSNNKTYEDWEYLEDENFNAYNMWEHYYSTKMQEYAEFLERSNNKDAVQECDNEIGYIRLNTYGLY